MGRVTSCRVVIESLEIVPEQLAAVLGHRDKKRQHHSQSLSTSLRSV